MTKRELIDQILHENATAEPGFLAQFSDEQLHEYLTHLKWRKQPRLRGDASRFDRYFRNCPPAVPPPASWRGAGQTAPAASRTSLGREALDLSARPAAPAPAPAKPASAAPKLPPPPARCAQFEAPLPADIDALEDMQLSVQERTVLSASSEEISEAEEPPAEQDPRPGPTPPTAPSPPSDTATDEQTWLF